MLHSYIALIDAKVPGVPIGVVPFTLPFTVRKMEGGESASPQPITVPRARTFDGKENSTCMKNQRRNFKEIKLYLLSKRLAKSNPDLSRNNSDANRRERATVFSLLRSSMDYNDLVKIINRRRCCKNASIRSKRVFRDFNYVIS